MDMNKSRISCLKGFLTNKGKISPLFRFKPWNDWYSDFWGDFHVTPSEGIARVNG